MLKLETWYIHRLHFNCHPFNWKTAVEESNKIVQFPIKSLVSKAYVNPGEKSMQHLSVVFDIFHILEILFRLYKYPQIHAL